MLRWDTSKSALCWSSKEVLGHEARKQPDWLSKIEVDLKPLLEKKNRLYALWSVTGNERDRKRHTGAQRVVRQAVRVEKDACLQHKAVEANRGMNCSKIVWRCIRDIHIARRGLVSERRAVVTDEDCNECISAEVQEER